MKKEITTAFALLFLCLCHSQIQFDPGYFIDNNGTKFECLIRNVDWKNNPTTIQYRLSADADIKEASIENISQFRVDDGAIYVRGRVLIDRSPDNNNVLDYEKGFDLKSEVLLLKTLISGEATLYYYEDSNLRRFFYSINDSEVTQLLYKRYRKSVSEIGTISTYKQQLFNSLKCGSLSRSQIEKSRYKMEDLRKLFMAYNQCKDPDYETGNNEQERLEININLRPGAHLSKLSIANDISNARDTDFGTGLGFRFGTEIEAVLPFNQGKWALFIEPTYHSYTAENTSVSNGPVPSTTAKVNYRSFEFPAGLRHYMFLTDKTMIFLNAAFVYDKAFGSSIDFESGSDLEIRSGSSWGLGLGATHGKISIEARYTSKRDLLQEYPSWDSEYGGVSLIFGYKIF